MDPTAGFNATARFSNRVADYERFRPGYPDGVVEALRRRIGLRPGEVVADLGAGTGIFSRLLLRHGVRVVAVEPNEAMRLAAERTHGAEAGFQSVAGRAEASGLAAASADAAVAAQAFHWFDPAATRREILRVLRAPPRVALIWNHRRGDDPFTRTYDALVAAAKPKDDPAPVHLVTPESDARTRAWFGPEGCAHDVLETEQRLDEEGLLGRAFSASYVPARGAPGHEAFERALRDAFARHAVDGHVTLRYATHVYAGVLST
jgi:SAM-dependent methyltransferase